MMKFTNGRYVWRRLLFVSAVFVSLLLLKRLHSEADNASWVSANYGQRFRRGNVRSELEIWNKPWPMRNVTWAKMNTSKGELDIMVYPEAMDKIVSYSLLVNGSWEPGEILAVERLFQCDPALGLIDIGANIGLYVLLGAKYGRPVVAVEPSMDNLGRLYASVQKNNFQRYVTMVHNAVSNKYTTMELSANPWNRGNTVILDSKNPNFHVPGEFEVKDRVHVGRVKTILMDDLIPVVSFRRGILKIDIEGAEKLAFEFSEKFLAQLDVPYIFMEWLWIKQDKPQAIHLYNFFIKRGYTPFKNSHLNMKLDDDLLNWPTDVFWVNLSRTGPCSANIDKWMKEDVKNVKVNKETGVLPSDILDRIRENQDSETMKKISIVFNVTIQWLLNSFSKRNSCRPNSPI